MAQNTPKQTLQEDPRYTLAFPKLTAKQLEKFKSFADRLTVEPGEFVWHAGETNLCMFVVLEGVMEIADGRTGSFIANHTKGSFSGDVDILSGRASVVSARAETKLELLQVQPDCVRSIVGEDPDLGTLLLRAFLIRRKMLTETDMGILILGSRYSPDTLRIREFLSRNHYPIHWTDLESDPDTGRLLKEFQVEESETPVVVLPSGELMLVPSNERLSKALGIMRPLENKLYDLVIVGSGPAGLAAAVYGASEGLSTLLVETGSPGGQAGTSSRIENYMGFPMGITGQELTDGALAQAGKFGAQLILPAEVTNITCSDTGTKTVEVTGMDNIETRTIILAPGASYRKIEASNLGDFEGRGVFYSATNVERLLCSDMAVCVVGGGNSAGQAAIYMAENARKVFLVIRADDLRKGMSSYLARRIEGSPKIEVLLNSEVCGLEGQEFLQTATIVDKKSGKSRKEELSGLFVMIGAVPHTSWLPPQVARDSKGFILTGQDAKVSDHWKISREPFFLETSCPGVFAAGDARSNSVKRVASAVGEGSMAVAFIHQYLSS
ncbi:MAG TPA: FAD-dependent oxidoreductase [Fimbriimonadaceae bacterium]|jgi:thioredoxin reductase (NADPH)